MTFEVRDHYTRYEHLIRMRDGVRLITSVLVPKDGARPYPILFMRTPFGLGPYGPDEDVSIGRQTGAPLEARYIFVRQGVRARW